MICDVFISVVWPITGRGGVYYREGGGVVICGLLVAPTTAVSATQSTSPPLPLPLPLLQNCTKWYEMYILHVCLHIYCTQHQLFYNKIMPPKHNSLVPLFLHCTKLPSYHNYIHSTHILVVLSMYINRVLAIINYVCNILYFCCHYISLLAAKFLVRIIAAIHFNLCLYLYIFLYVYLCISIVLYLLAAGAAEFPVRIIAAIKVNL